MTGSDFAQKPEVILSSDAPVGGMQAFVEKSSSCYYFYLWRPVENGARILHLCWICNRKKAPAKLDTRTMGKGNAPMMPAEFVGHDPGGMELDKDKLTITWFASCDSAALWNGDDLICVIPGYAGLHGFPGFSRYARGTGPYGWGFAEKGEELERDVLENVKFWGYMSRDPWPEIQKKHIAVLEKFLDAPYEKYYAIDRGKFPMRGMITGRKGRIMYDLTLGVSQLPMPKAELVFRRDAPKFHRIELGFAAQEQFADRMAPMGGILSGISDIPWQEQDFLGHGHTIGFAGIEGFANLLAVNPHLVPGLEKPEYPYFWGSRINLLWLVPITVRETAYLREKGINALLKLASSPEKIHIFNEKPHFLL